MKLFLSPAVKSCIITPPHADGRMLKGALHFVLPLSHLALYNRVQTWLPRVDYALDDKTGLIADKTLQAALYLDPDGGSQDRTKGESVADSPVVSIGRSPSRSIPVCAGSLRPWR